MKIRDIFLTLLAAGSLIWVAANPPSVAYATDPQITPVNQVVSATPAAVHANTQPTPIRQPLAPNGSYINLEGNNVPRPYVSSSIPAGATAQCGDNTYSFSQHRQGTCSHHRGVATWL